MFTLFYLYTRRATRETHRRCARNWNADVFGSCQKHVPRCCFLEVRVSDGVFSFRIVSESHGTRGNNTRHTEPYFEALSAEQQFPVGLQKSQNQSKREVPDILPYLLQVGCSGPNTFRDAHVQSRAVYTMRFDKLTSSESQLPQSVRDFSRYCSYDQSQAGHLI
ncbi:hypothetical protein VTK56DRAFT_8388 [Thermocarpiscus australiensis]